MKKQAVNPYLPEWEHIPDGEPRVFGDRVYIYGSHDEDGGDEFSLLDYACWSAPVDDLGNWRYEGVIYRKEQEPLQQDTSIPGIPKRKAAGLPHLLFAPDAVQGKDGRYYLYYSMDFSNMISVAVCDTPAGQYKFFAHVTRKNGSRPENIQWFDPGVLCDEAGVYLYMGSAPLKRFPEMGNHPIPGGMGIRLADDMHTIIGEPFLCANGIETCTGTSYEQHPFFEASSIRHFGEWYYHIYSSLQGHELCYGMAKSPEGPFTFKGVLVSNADIGYKGTTQPQNYPGNNHGSIAKIGEKYYIFGHRHTHGGQFSRQGFAEELTMNADGTFNQAGLTSCGLNGGPLKGNVSYSATIACCLMGPDREHMAVLPNLPHNGPENPMPYHTGMRDEKAPNGYFSWIENLRPGAAFGYKFLDFSPACNSLSMLLRGSGFVQLHFDNLTNPAVAVLSVSSDVWQYVQIPIPQIENVHAVFFSVHGGESDILACAQFQFGALS
ncbi:MAG: family 43 glycosylhydrolase [Clostridia bacterium]|nr:family 43 glycosylhydrolase [Clostridia bacterium]